MYLHSGSKLKQLDCIGSANLDPLGLRRIVENFVDLRSAYREEHLRRVQEAHSRGELVLAGALAEPADRALLVFRGKSPTGAESFAAGDPYVTNGLVT